MTKDPARQEEQATATRDDANCQSSRSLVCADSSSRATTEELMRWVDEKASTTKVTLIAEAGFWCVQTPVAGQQQKN